MMRTYFPQINKNEFKLFPLQKANIRAEQEEANISKNRGSTVVTAQKGGNMAQQELTEGIYKFWIGFMKCLLDNVLQKANNNCNFFLRTTLLYTS